MKPRKAHIFEKERHGHYVEPAWVSERLFAVENFRGSVVYDPAVGWGTITRSAQAAGYDVLGSDIVDRGRHRLRNFFKKDFLRDKFAVEPMPPWFSVVSNPPYDHMREFCERALEIGAAKVAMICLVRRLNAAHWLARLPLQTVYLLSPRPSMPPGAWIAAGNKPGGGTQDFCWIIMRAGYTGAPQLKWLHRDGDDQASGIQSAALAAAK